MHVENEIYRGKEREPPDVRRDISFTNIVVYRDESVLHNNAHSTTNKNVCPICVSAC